MKNYSDRINKKLAELSIALDPKTLAMFALREGVLDSNIYVSGSDEWKLVSMYYGYKSCDLCGHNPINRVFVIESRQGKKLEIGSECVRNYVHADLIDGLCRLFEAERLKIVNPEKYAEFIPALEWGLKYDLMIYNMLPYNHRLFSLPWRGSPRCILEKLNGGKQITAKDKEAMRIWSELYAQGDELLAVYYVCRWLRGVGMQIEYLRDRVAMSVAEALQNLGRFIVINEAEKQKAVVSVALALQAVGKAVSNIPDIKEMFSLVMHKPMNRKTRWFVQSLYSYYCRKGTLTDKQYACLVKLATA